MPTLSSATVDGTALRLNYNEALDTASTPATTDFTVSVAGTDQTPSVVVVSGSAVTLTLGTAATPGQAVTVSYTKGTNPIQDVAGNDAAALSNQSVTNNTALVANINEKPSTSTFTFNRDIAQAFTTGSNSEGYTLTSVAVGMKLTSVAEPNYSVFIHEGSTDSPGEPAATSLGELTTTSAPRLNFTLVQFDASGNGISLDASTEYWVVIDMAGVGDMEYRATASDNEDSGGAAGWTIADTHLQRTVVSTTWVATNQNTVWIRVNGSVDLETTVPTLSSATVDGTALKLNYNEALDTGSVPATSAFTVSVAGTDQTPSGVSVSGSSVDLTLGTGATPGQAVTVSYTVPGTNPIQDLAGNDAGALSSQSVTNNTVTVRLVANAGQADASGAGGGLGSDRAQSFTTGTNSLGYRMTSVELDVQAGGAHTYTARMAFNASPGPGNAVVATLEKPASLTTGFDNEFTGDVDLLPNTTYFFVIDSGASTPAVTLRQTTGDGEDSGGATGWSIGNTQHRRTHSSTGTWTSVADALKIIVNGYPKAPALNRADIDGTELELTFDGDLDTASGTAAGAFTIKVDGGAAQAASGMTIAGKKVTLTVPAVTADQVVTVTYTRPGTNPLKGSNAQAVPGFTDRPVVNSTPKLVSNLDLGADNLQSTAFDFTTPFTTGPEGYALSSVDIKFSVVAGAQPTYNVELWAILSGVPSAKLATFDKPSTVTNGTNRFTLSTAHVLTASRTYAIVYDQTTAGTNIRPIRTHSDGEESGKAAGWSIGDRGHARNVTDTAWTGDNEVLKLALYGQPASSTLIGNNSEADKTQFHFNSDRAQPFTTGTNSTGYRLTSVQFGVKTAGSPNHYKVKITSDSGSGPGAELATLENPSSLTVGLNSFTGDVDLAPNTTYYIVTDLTTNAGGAQWKRTSSDDEDSGGAAGWNVGDKFWFRAFGSAGAWSEESSSDVMKVVLKGYAKETSDTATADAGEDQAVQTGTFVRLDGSGSATTTTGATLTYAWTQTSGPTVTLSDATAVNPTFTAPAYRADYVFSLVVDDGGGISAADAVTITVRPPLNPATAPCQSPDEGATVDATVVSTPTTTASAITWGATATGGAGTADLYLCSPDGTRELVGSAVATGTTSTKSGLDSGTKYWVGALKTLTSDSTVSWSGWKAATTTGGASIVAVQIASTPRFDADKDGEPDTYGLGGTIQVDVTYSQNVTVIGKSNVRMRLDVGTDDTTQTNSRRVATVASGGGTTKLRFEYTVVANDLDADGIWVQAQANNSIIILAGVSSIANGTNNAKLTKSGLPTTGDPKHKVDHNLSATVPTFANATETLEIDENSAEGATVGTVTATDTDGDTLYYSLRETGDYARFTIVESGAGAGTIKVAAGQNFDYETAPNSYTVTVDVTDKEDSDGNTETTPATDATVVVTINETNVEEPPGAPTVTAVTGASASSLGVTWTAPSNTGATAITDYDVRYYAGTAAPADPADWIEEGETNGHTHTGTATTATITGLTDSTLYQVQVRAEGDGEGPWSAARSGATLGRPVVSTVAIASNPGADLTYQQGDTISVRLTFNETVTVTGTPRLKIKLGTTTSDERWANFSAGSGTAALVFRYTVVSPDTSTSGVAVPLNTLELNSGTITSVATSQTAKLPHAGLAQNSNHKVDSSPPAPTGLSATVGDEEITLRWTNPSDSTITKYSYRVSDDGGTTWNPDWGDISGSGAATTMHTVTGLTNDTEHTFELAAVRSTANRGASASVKATPRPDPPPAPAGLNADPGNAKVTLTWTDPVDTDISVYQYRQSTNGGNTWNPGWTVITASDDTTVEHELTGLMNDTTYTIEVRSRRGTVTTGAASRVAVTPKAPPPAPRNLRATPADGEIVVDWTNPNDATITKYQFRQSIDGGTNWNPDWTDISSSGSATTSLTRSSLTNNTTYYDIEVRAVRGSANEGTAAAIGATPLSTGPAAPAGLSATGADTQVSLSWSAGGSTVDRYRVRHRASGGSFPNTWTTISGRTTTTHTESSLMNGTTYRFEVQAGTSATALGPASAIEATPTERPAAPANLVPHARPRTIALSWDDPSDSTITRYQFRRSTDGGTNWNPGWTDIAGSDDTTTTHTLSNLANGTTYTIEIRAARGTTFGAERQVMATPRPAPPTPAGFTATAGDEQADLSWTNPSDTSITKYQSRHRADGETNWTDWADIDGTSATHTVTSLTNDTTYTFQLRAVRDRDNAGPPASKTAIPRPTVPAAPASFAATAGDAQVDLSWSDPTNSQITGYQYRRKVGTGSWNPNWTDIDGSGASTTMHTVTSLDNDTTYTFEVRAKAGAVIVSSESSVTIKTPKPAPRSFVARAGNGQVELSWTDPNDDEITEYQLRQRPDGGSWTGWGAILNSDKDTTTHTVLSLGNGTAVTFEVRARGLGSPPQEGVAARIESTPLDTATRPPAPTQPRAVAGNARVTVSWTKPEAETITETITRYQYRVSADKGATWNPDWTDIDNSSATTTSHAVTDLENDTIYQIDIRAVYSPTDLGAVASMIATPKRPVSSSSGGFGGGGGGGGPSPSVVDYEWTVKHDIEALARGNDTPTGMWSDGTTIWLADNGQGADDEVYAYDLATGQRVEAREFALHSTNRAPRGFWSNGETVWVSDSGRDHVFAYDLAGGDRLEAREIALETVNRDARGIWSDGETLWVLDGRANALFAYDLESGRLLAHYELDGRNRDPRGIWSDGTTVWVSDHGAKALFAYRLPEPPPGEDPAVDAGEVQAASNHLPEPVPLERVRDEEFTHLSSSSNNSPRGIWSDGAVMYVTDQSDGRVYTYNMPDAIDSRLASLVIEGVDFGEFDPGQTEYKGTADEGVTETVVTAEAMQRGTTVVIEPPDAAEATPGHQLALDGVDAVTVTVTSADGSRTRVYRVQLAAASCLLGAVGEGFRLVVHEGGTVDELDACARDRSVGALYALHEGAYVPYFPGAPEFVNEAFTALYADGVPALTPLVAASEGPPSGSPALAVDDAEPSWSECLPGSIPSGYSAAVYEGGSIEDLAACALGRNVAALYALHEGDWVPYDVGGTEAENQPFAELFPDGLPAVTPLVVRSDGPPPVTAAGSGGDN